ncbi:MAG: hypothetical protein M1480_04205 [Bacteroidetes bacterium]|nr:hypothetical protein [Bacteroidota bacterium]
MQRFFLVIISVIVIAAVNFAQENTASEDSIEVTVIDSYVTPEIPHTFLLTFFSSSDCKSKVIIDKKYEYKVSDSLTVNHSVKIDLTGLSFKKKSVPFVIMVQDSLGKVFRSDNYEFDLPSEVKVQSESNFLLLCLFGGAVFALPSPDYVSTDNGNYFSLTKEIPIVSFRSANFNYPFGYFSAEYSYIFKAQDKNFFRLGYKQLIDVPDIQYISPGIDWFTNFKGFNGISAELSIGWIKIFSTFTIYTRYRFNIKPSDSSSKFHEFSIGLYSSFFSVYF